MTLSNNSGVQGGAIGAVRSEKYINEGMVISQYTAKSGGGVFMRKSALTVHHPIEISQNTAQNGGGIYAYCRRLLLVVNYSPCVHAAIWKLDCP